MALARGTLELVQAPIRVFVPSPSNGSKQLHPLGYLEGSLRRGARSKHSGTAELALSLRDCRQVPPATRVRAPSSVRDDNGPACRPGVQQECSESTRRRRGERPVSASFLAGARHSPRPDI